MECAINITMKGLVTRWEKFATKQTLTCPILAGSSLLAWINVSTDNINITCTCNVMNAWSDSVLSHIFLAKTIYIPPARIVQSRILDSKVINAFSAPSFTLRCLVPMLLVLIENGTRKNQHPIDWHWLNPMTLFGCIPLLKKMLFTVINTRIS